MEKKIILWSDDLKTGIEWQDYQHREFLKLTNQIFDMFYERKGRIDIDLTVNFMEQYAQNHFGIEERYMTLLDYPARNGHKTMHLQFKAFINDIRTTPTDSVMESARICNKLNNWFVEHIKVVDKELGAFLKGKSQL